MTKSYTDRLFEEERRPFFITTLQAAEQALIKHVIYSYNGAESFKRWDNLYLLEIRSPRGFRTVMRALKILEENSKGYKVREVTDAQEFKRIDKCFGIRKP